MSNSLKQLRTDWLEELELGQGRSPRTVAAYDRYLTRFFDQQHVREVPAITLDAVRTFRRFLHDTAGAAPPTINYYLIALRQFLTYLAKRDVPALSPDKVGLAKLPERDVHVLYPEEVDALLAAAEQQQSRASDDPASRTAARRDSALLQTLFSTGLRISEAIALNRDDIRSAREIPVRGKGNKVRVVFLSDQARAALNRYLADRHDTDAALFIRQRSAKGGALADSSTIDRRLSVRSVQRLIKKYAALAGITKNITPHSLRHSFATDLLANGADVRQVQALLGHASITTTQIYTHLTDAGLKDVHTKYHRKKETRLHTKPT